jgi:acetylglutamate kinase
MVLTGQVNRDVVGLINRHGPFAVGMSGEDANMFTASRRHAVVDGSPVDVGLVGEIETVDPAAVRALLADGRIPVVSSVARGTGGEVYNVNADAAAAALAVALGAAKLIVLTDVAGLYADWPGGGSPSVRISAPMGDNIRTDHGMGIAMAGGGPAPGQPRRLISVATVSEVERLLPTLTSGMIPKMEACLRAVRGGVPQAHVLDGRLPHAVLLEIFTDSGIGTMVVPDGAGSRSAEVAGR